MSERVLQELRLQLARGRYVPGDRLGVDRIAAEFDVSPVPVREAMRVLLAEGRVEYSAHRGYRVTRLTVEDVEEIFLMCGLLEREALLRGVPRMDEAAVDRMEQCLRGLETATGDDALWEQVQLHQEFHFVPIEQARLPRMEGTLRRFWDHTDHYRGLYLFQGEEDGVLRRQHWDLLAACARRDADRAIELTNRHRARALEILARGVSAAAVAEGMP